MQDLLIQIRAHNRKEALATLTGLMADIETGFTGIERGQMENCSEYEINVAGMDEECPIPTPDKEDEEEEDEEEDTVPALRVLSLRQNRPARWNNTNPARQKAIRRT